MPAVAAAVSCRWRVLVSNLSGLSGLAVLSAGTAAQPALQYGAAIAAYVPPIRSYWLRTYTR